METWARPPQPRPHDSGDQKGTAWGRPIKCHPLGHHVTPPKSPPPPALTLASQRLWETILQTVGTQRGHRGVTSAAPRDGAGGRQRGGRMWGRGGVGQRDTGTWGCGDTGVWGQGDVGDLQTWERGDGNRERTWVTRRRRGCRDTGTEGQRGRGAGRCFTSAEEPLGAHGVPTDGAASRPLPERFLLEGVGRRRGGLRRGGGGQHGNAGTRWGCGARGWPSRPVPSRPPPVSPTHEPPRLIPLQEAVRTQPRKWPWGGEKGGATGVGNGRHGMGGRGGKGGQFSLCRCGAAANGMAAIGGRDPKPNVDTPPPAPPVSPPPEEPRPEE